MPKVKNKTKLKKKPHTQHLHDYFRIQAVI